MPHSIDSDDAYPSDLTRVALNTSGYLHRLELTGREQRRRSERENRRQPRQQNTPSANTNVRGFQ